MEQFEAYRRNLLIINHKIIQLSSRRCRLSRIGDIIVVFVSSMSHNNFSINRSKPVYGPPPKQSYGIPSTSYGVPASGYGVPASAYGAPSNHRISASASQHHPQYVNAPVNVETNSLVS